MDHAHAVSEIARPRSQAGQMQAHAHHRQMSSATLPDTFQRSRSDTMTSTKSRPRPKSRGSTTSIQSAGTAVHYQQDQPPGHALFIPTQHQQQLCNASPEEMLARYGQEQFAQTQQYNLDPGLPAQQQSEMQSHEMQQYAMHSQDYSQGIPQYGTSHDHMQHALARTGTFDAADNQSPAPEDSETADNGQRRKKGSATSLANDAELRRLVHQYQGQTLKDVAAEVQQNEGGGGKSEKAKQVFAMLWLQESCQRSSNSVRRDRVFQRYTERCGDERVPTLNPASFGKLVRIIFPNVQTRRLGVRGESKYHYVDLSLVPLEGSRTDAYQPQTFSRPVSQHARNDSLEDASMAHQIHTRNGSIHQLSAAPPDTAEFPAPSASFGPQSADLTTRYNVYPPPARAKGKMHCDKSNASLLRIPTNNMSTSLIACLPSIRSCLPATLTTYLGLPSSTSHTSPSLSQTEAKIELPDIHSYLDGVHYDPPIADSLSSLYRSYCIMVIDSFRFCREKPFFHHHSAFNGTMTVPVAKLLAEPRVAAWIQECDMRMYKKMIRYIAPLVTQVVPEPVWAMFDRVSTKLVSHLVGAFEEKCPIHVVAAKVVPATRFCNLLKKLVRVNQTANNVAPLLSDERTRSQMWADMVKLVSPERLLDESMPSPECWNAVERNLRDEMRALLTPLDDEALRQIEAEGSTEWSQYFANTTIPGESNPAQPLSEGSLDRWIQWLEKLPEAFEGHHPQCIIDWHTRFWDSILTQFGMGGAQSYQAWWFLKAFLSSMLGWMTQMEGLLLPEAEQRRVEDIEKAKRVQDEGWTVGHARSSASFASTSGPNMKRKRTQDDVGGDERAAASRGASANSEEVYSFRRETGTHPRISASAEVTTSDEDEQEKADDEMDHPPLELPSIETADPPKRLHQSHDDSGISLDAEIEDGVGAEVTGGAAPVDDNAGVREKEKEKEKQKQKRLRREWGILSDGPDAMGEVVVI